MANAAKKRISKGPIMNCISLRNFVAVSILAVVCGTFSVLLAVAPIA
ncbi:hypothetical protein [Sphingomicrobium nitratireducens]|nr:hypothetical protein [Sphingomicrobium nitratireducens]